MRNVVRVLGAAVVGAVLLTGCLRVEMAFDIHDDGTGDFAAEFAFNTDTLAEFGEAIGMPVDDFGDMTADELFAEMDTDDPCSDFGAGLEDYGVVREEIAGDGEIGVRCSVEGVPLDEFSSFDDEMAMSIDQSDDRIVFSMELSGVSDLYGGEDAVPLPGFDIEELVSFDVKVAAPGSLKEHNATSTDGNEATWSLAPDAEFVEGDVAAMNAQWEPGSDSSSNWIIVLVIAVVALAVLVAVVVAMRGGKSSAGDSAGDITSPPPPPPGGEGTSAAPPAPPASPPPPPAEGSPGGDLPPPPAG